MEACGDVEASGGGGGVEVHCDVEDDVEVARGDTQVEDEEVHGDVEDHGDVGNRAVCDDGVGVACADGACGGIYCDDVGVRD